jgi:CRISPR-associated endoribonuclease Cas6
MTLPQLTSLVLELHPQRAYDQVEPIGRAVHALALEAIGAADPALAAAVHDRQGPKPFTVSGLMGLHFREVTPEQTGVVRLTALNEAVSGAFSRAADAGGPWAPGQTLSLANTAWEIAAVHQAERGHTWAASTTYEALSAPWLLGRRPVERHIRLQFSSPTTFKSNDLHLPVPLPGMVWGSLLDRWNAFAPVALPPEVRRFAEACLALSRYELRTRMVPVKAGGLRTGAVGWAEYTAVRGDPHWLGMIQLLADFALFSGVGAGTGMGLGQTRRQSAGARVDSTPA